ncbi:MAG: D-alanyl-D-alanine carboxypeptidase/D-alanyl-D-alanine-endopeptidase, partial [Pirellulales bacterium]
MMASCFAAFALLALAVAPSRAATLQERLSALLKRPALAGARVGVRVVDAATGQALFARNADAALIPASNMKLVTTAAALELLGEDYRFRTVVGMDGDDLVVIGGGDPTLGAGGEDSDPTRPLRDWIGRLERDGLRSAIGDVVLDDSRFDRQFVHPAWPRGQLHRQYAAPVGALALGGNRVAVHVMPAQRPGDPASVRTMPAAGGLRLRGQIKTIASRKGHLWSIYRRPGSDTVHLDGRFWVSGKEAAAPVTVDDPTRHFAQVLQAVLRDKGIEVRGRVRTAAHAAPQRLRPRIVHETPLAAVLRGANKDSDNFYAEQLFKTLGAETAGTGSWETGRRAIGEMLRRLGIGRQGIIIDDGSGLSRNNRLTARQVTELLCRMATGPHGEAYLDSLSVAGADGTLGTWLREDGYRGYIRAKTGTLGGVRAL